MRAALVFACAASTLHAFPLHDACDRGQLALLTQLLAEGHPIDQRSEQGDTPLHVASARRNAKVVAALLQANASVDLRDQNGRSALMHASSSGLVESVRLLLLSGADADAQDRLGEGAVHRAAERGHSGVVQLLLSEGGANANLHSYTCTSPYHLAASNCHGETARILHSAGAFTNVKPRVVSYDAFVEPPTRSKRRCTAFPDLPAVPSPPKSFCARPLAPVDMTIAQVQLGSPPTSNALDGAALAAWTESARQVTEVLKAFFDAHPTPHEGAVTDLSRYTPLQLVSSHGDLDAAAALLKLGAHPDAQEARRALGDGATALHLASFGGFANVVRLLLQAGADRTRRTISDGFVPLHVAALRGHADAVRLLVERTAASVGEAAAAVSVDVRSAAASGRALTALMLASFGGHEAAVRVLLRAGARLDLRWEGRSAADLARLSAAGGDEVVAAELGVVMPHAGHTRTLGHLARAAARRGRNAAVEGEGRRDERAGMASVGHERKQGRAEATESASVAVGANESVGTDGNAVHPDMAARVLDGSSSAAARADAVWSVVAALTVLLATAICARGRVRGGSPSPATVEVKQRAHKPRRGSGKAAARDAEPDHREGEQPAPPPSLETSDAAPVSARACVAPPVRTAEEAAEAEDAEVAAAAAAASRAREAAAAAEAAALEAEAKATLAVAAAAEAAQLAAKVAGQRTWEVVKRKADPGGKADKIEGGKRNASDARRTISPSRGRSDGAMSDVSSSGGSSQGKGGSEKSSSGGKVRERNWSTGRTHDTSRLTPPPPASPMATGGTFALEAPASPPQLLPKQVPQPAKAATRRSKKAVPIELRGARKKSSPQLNVKAQEFVPQLMLPPPCDEYTTQHYYEQHDLAACMYEGEAYASMYHPMYADPYREYAHVSGYFPSPSCGNHFDEQCMYLPPGKCVLAAMPPQDASPTSCSSRIPCTEQEATLCADQCDTVAPIVEEQWSEV
ncbi:hypothetical protein AB1Y20_002075 [Prymnesium parvum]|uniref:Uncharacterized protein n=1 Tax=Prymnesium parvum TaxID=97485 RepID=A0AB34J9J0_PRYPA